MDTSQPPVAANARVAAIFEEIADLLELEDANPFRVRAYRNAARVLRGTRRDVAAMIDAGEDLTELPGVGDDLAGKIREIVATGTVPLLAELHARWPESLHEVLRVPGVGPKRARALLERLGVRGVADLAAAAAAGRVRGVPGFGVRSERNLLDAVAGLLGSGRRMRLDAVRPQAQRLLARLRRAPGVTELALAGSYRRGCAMIGDLDVVAVAAPPGAVIDGLAADPEVARVLARGTTRATVLLRSGLQVDLRAVGRESFGAALHYFTGSKSHNIAVRRLGAALGLKVNEYGVFRGARRVAGDTEASVYAALGLPFIPPELREDQGEIEAAREGRLPRLIEAGDLRGDLVVVPPSAEIEALVDAAAAAARAQGRDYLVVLHVIGAQPRPPRELRARVQAAARTARLRRVALLQGAEIDLVHGARAATPLDFTAGRVAVAGEASVRAALHRLARGRPALVRVVARPDGRDAPVDLEGLVAAARGAVLATDDAPEHFLWLERLFRAARLEGTTLLIGTGGETDAARLEQVLSQARRAGLTAGSVGNTRPLAELGAALRKARGRPAASTTRARAVDRESSRAP